MLNIGDKMDECKLVKVITQIELKKLMNIYGIEGTEEKIKHLYRSMPKFKSYLLKEYNNILRRRN